MNGPNDCRGRNDLILTRLLYSLEPQGPRICGGPFVCGDGGGVCGVGGGALEGGRMEEMKIKFWFEWIYGLFLLFVFLVVLVGMLKFIGMFFGLDRPVG